MSRPKNSNADDWCLFIKEHPAPYVAVQVAAAIEEAAANALSRGAVYDGRPEQNFFKRIWGPPLVIGVGVGLILAALGIHLISGFLVEPF